MHELLVGLDLLAVELDQTYLEGYRDLLARLLAKAEETMGREEVMGRLKAPSVRDGLEQLIAIRGEEIRLDHEAYSAVVKVLARLARGESVELINCLRSEVLAACSDLGLPIPPVGAGMEEGPESESIGPDRIDMQPRGLT